MMWDHVMAYVQSLLIADAVLEPLFGTNVRKAGVSDLLIPSIEWTLLGDGESELWAPMLVQFDVWTSVAADARTAERRLRSLFHKDTSVTFDAYTVFTSYSDGADLATPDRANHVGRAVRFRFTPLREQYARPA